MPEGVVVTGVQTNLRTQAALWLRAMLWQVVERGELTATSTIRRRRRESEVAEVGGAEAGAKRQARMNTQKKTRGNEPA